MIFRFKQLAVLTLLAMAFHANAANVTKNEHDFDISTDTEVIVSLGFPGLFDAARFSSERENGNENGRGKSEKWSFDFQGDDNGKSFEQFSRNNRDDEGRNENRFGEREHEREFEFGDREFHFKGEEHYHVTSVPEPDSLAMLLAGLGMITVVASRRGKRA